MPTTSRHIYHYVDRLRQTSLNIHIAWGTRNRLPFTEYTVTSTVTHANGVFTSHVVVPQDEMEALVRAVLNPDLLS